MKIRDKELREAAERVDCDYAFKSVEREKAAASELLQRRREVRRLRRAMKLAVSLMRDTLSKRFPLSYMLDARAVISAALKPQRGGK